MKTALFCSMIVLGVMPLAASAEEVSSSFSWGAVTFQPRAYMGYADFSIERKISAKDAREKIKINPELHETSKDHHDTLKLLVLYKPELFTPENAPFMCDEYDRFIEECFKETYQQELNLKK